MNLDLKNSFNKMSLNSGENVEQNLENCMCNYCISSDHKWLLQFDHEFNEYKENVWEYCLQVPGVDVCEECAECRASVCKGTEQLPNG